MNRLCFLILAIIAMFCVMIGSVLVTSQVAATPHLQSLADAFRLYQCGQFCWHNIHLGKTTLAEAKTILSTDPNIILLDGDSKGCQIAWQTIVEKVTWKGHICAGIDGKLSDLAALLDLSSADEFADTQFTLMDAIEIFGMPTSARCLSISLLNGASSYTASVIFKGETQVSFTHKLPYNGLLFDPKMPISRIRYSSEDEQRYYRSTSAILRGFTSEHFATNIYPNPCTIAIE
jgi:hypothetical protein